MSQLSIEKRCSSNMSTSVVFTLDDHSDVVVFPVDSVSGFCSFDRTLCDSLQNLQDAETLPGQTLATDCSQRLI